MVRVSLNDKRVLAKAVFVLALLFIFFFVIESLSLPVTHVSDRRAGGDTLNVAVELSPMTLSTASDSIEGFGYDLLKNITEAHGRPIKINAFSSLPEALDKLAEGRYDLVVADMPVTASLKEKYRFTMPVYRDRQVLVQLVDSAGNVEVGSQTALGGKEVWAAAGTPIVSRLHTLSREIGDSIIVVEDNSYTEEQLLIAVAIGEIPRAAAGQLVAQRMAVDYPQLDTSVDLSFSQLKSWAVAPGDSALVDTLDSWIEAFMLTGSYRDLLRKYGL